MLPPRIQSTTGPWWHAAEEKIAAVVWSHLCALADVRSKRLRQVAQLVRAYERELWDDWTMSMSRDVVGDDVVLAMGGEGWDPERDPWYGGSYNVLRINVEGYATRLIQRAPAVETKLRNVQYEQMIQADDIDGFLDGTVNNEEAEVAFMPFAITGVLTGLAFAMPVRRGDKIVTQCLSEQEVWWDPADARGGNPRSLHVTYPVSRSEILGELQQRGESPKSALWRDVDRLESADSLGPYGDRGVFLPYDQELIKQFGHAAQSSDLLHKVVSWHLPGYTGADDGRVVETVHGGQSGAPGSVMLRDEKWTYDTFPVVWWSPGPPYQGLYSPSPGQIQVPFQRSMDRIYHGLDADAAHYGRATLITSGTMATEVKERFKDAGVDVLDTEQAGGNPEKPYEFVHNQVHNPQVIEWKREIEGMAANAIGASAPALQGRSNLGAAASGVAQIVELDRGDERLAIAAQRLGEARLRLAVEYLNAADRAAKDDPAFAVQVFGRGGEARRFAWTKLDLPRTAYDLQMSRVGGTSREKSGRLQQILEMAQAGSIPQDDAMAEFANHADLRRVVETSQAGRSLVEWQLAELSRPNQDDYSEFMPVRDQDLQVALRMALNVKMLARRRGATPETLDRLTEYAALAKELIRQVAAENAPPTPMKPTPGLGAAMVSPDDMGLDETALMAPEMMQ